MRGFTSLLRVYIADLTGADSHVPLPLPDVLDNVPAQSLAMRNSADVALALLYSVRGRFQEAETILIRTIRRDQEAKGTTAVPIACSLLARNFILLGRLRHAAALLEEHIAWVEQRGAWRFYLAGNLHTNLAEVLREWNRLDEADEILRTGRALNEAWDIPNALVTGCLAQSRLLRARGDLHGARDALEQGERLAAGRFLPLDARKELEIEQVRLWLDSGELERAQAWAAELPPPDPADFRQEATLITLARVLLSTGRYSECHALLQPAVERVQSGLRPGRLGLLLLLDALALSGTGDAEDSLALLDHCLELAAPQGYVRTFLECGAAMRSLLEQHQRRPNPPHFAYTQSLLDAFGSRSLPAMHSLVEPLTPRELDVLRLVCEGLSNQEIAAKLSITISAVKKHTGNIYGKLGVTSRTQAMRRAQGLGLAGPEG
jgi:LuxR family maltose regulon positive regulatory protein